IALGEHARALVEAKRLFNVCRAEQTGMAVDVVTAALSSSREPKDIERARQFKMRQTLGARGDMNGMIVAAGASAPPHRPASDDDPLKSVVLADAGFTVAINKLGSKTDTRSRTARGNLLLMAGRIAEARRVFEALKNEAPDAKAVAATLERLVAVMRAEDGNSDRANMEIRRLREAE
ncbi:MAG: hypothetical protein H7144_07960, partial [Burkholderiales bacterium]|nr:hypothetical protein [Phycisphaerae bacterium]